MPKKNNNTGEEYLKQRLKDLELELELKNSNLAVTVEELKTSLEELRESESRLRGKHEQMEFLIESSGGAFWSFEIKKGDKGIPEDAEVSERMLNFLGYNASELSLSMKKWHKKILAEDFNHVMDKMEQLIAGKLNRTKMLFRVRNKEQDIVWIERDVFTGKDSYGNPILCSGVDYDVTLSKKAEEAKIENFLKKEMLIKAFGEVIYEHHITEDTIKWGGAVKKVLGYSLEELGSNGRSWLERVHPEDLDNVLEEFNRARKENLLFDYTYRFRHKNGHYLWMHDRGVMRTGPDGELHGVYGILKDITAKAEHDKIIEESREKLRAFMDSATDSFLLLDKRFNILDINQNALEFFNFNREEMLGRNLIEFVPEMETSGQAENFRKVIKTGIPFVSDGFDKDSGGGRRYYTVKAFRAAEGLGLIITDITPRVKMEEELRDHRYRLQIALEAGRLGVWEWDIINNLAEFNDNFYDMLGYEKEDIQSDVNRLFSLLHPDDKNKMLQKAGDFRKGMINEKPSVVRLKTKAKSWRWVEITGKVVEWNQAGTPVKMIGIISDIHNTKTAAEALKKSELLYRTLAESSQDYIFIIDPFGFVEYVNEFGARIFRSQISQIVGKPLKELFPEYLYEKMWNNIRDVYKSEKTKEYHNPIEFPEGVLWLHTKLIPIKNRDGEIERVMGVSRDLTDIQKQQDAVMLAETKLKSMMNAISESTALIDSSGTIDMVNDSAARRFGKEPQELIGMNVFDILPESVAKSRKKKIDKVFETGQPVYFEDKRGSNFYYNSIYPVKDENGITTHVTVFAIDFTKIKQYEKELKIKDIALKFSLSAFSIADLKGNLTYVNPVFKAIWDYDISDDITGRHISEFFKDNKHTEYIIKEIFDKGNWKGELTAVKKNGVPFMVFASASMVYDEKGKPLCLTCSIIDISDRKKSEDKLGLLSKVFMDAIDPIVISDTENIIIDLNEQAVKAYQWERNELTGQKVNAIIPEEYLKKELSYLKKCMAGEIIREVDSVRVKKDGSLVPVLLTLSRLTGENDSLIGAASIAKDISDLRKAERGIRESEIKFRLIFENAMDAIFWMDGETGVLVNCNKAAEVLMEKPREEIIGGHFLSLFPENLQKEIEENSKRFEQITEPPPVTSVIITKRGNLIPVEIVTSTTKIGGRIIRQGSFRNITERKRHEEALRRFNKELRRSNLELQQFAYITSHDLQEPLRGISGSLQIVQKKTEKLLDEETLKFMNYAIEGSARMQDMINDMLAFSRVETKGGSFKRTSLKEVIDEVKKNLRRIIEETAAVIVYDYLPDINADKRQIVQLFQNLISNALKFRSNEIPYIKIACTDDDKYRQFSIEDNGIGIKKEYFPRIFEIFKRLNKKSKYPGTGIGLALCKRIVERHGGKIWVESEPGKGSVFFFTLPKEPYDI